MLISLAKAAFASPGMPMSGTAQPAASPVRKPTRLRWLAYALATLGIFAGGTCGLFSALTSEVISHEQFVCPRCAMFEWRQIRTVQSRDGSELLYRRTDSAQLMERTRLSDVLDPGASCVHDWVPVAPPIAALDFGLRQWCTYLLGIDIVNRDVPGVTTSMCMPDVETTLSMLRENVKEREPLNLQYDALWTGVCAGGELRYIHRIEGETETILFYGADKGEFLAVNDVMNRYRAPGLGRGERDWPTRLDFPDMTRVEDLLQGVNKTSRDPLLEAASPAEPTQP
jgi:hypothetical protein